MGYEHYQVWRPGIEVRYNSDVFRGTVFEHLAWIYSKPMGKIILDSVLGYKSQLLHSNLKIEEHVGGISYGDFERERIDYDVNYRPLDPTYDRVIAARAFPVYLYHELVHAYRATQDVFLQSNGGVGNLEEEFTTTGLFEYADTWLSENAFRRSLRLRRRPSYFMEGPEGDGKEQERKRRYFLMLPSVGYNEREFEFTPPNPFTRQIDPHKFNLYVGHHYEREKRQWPNGFPAALRPEQAARREGYGPPLTPPGM